MSRDYDKWFDYDFLPMKIEEYFKENEVSLEKIEYIESQLKLNLTKYKKNLLNNINDINEKISDNSKIFHNKNKKSRIKKI